MPGEGRRFQPGQPNANPGGFRREKQFKAALLRVLLTNDAQMLRDIVQKLCTEALNGEPWAIMMIADRIDGKCPQTFYSDDEEAARIPLRGVIEFVRAANDT
jgi:hypothetical protein